MRLLLFPCIFLATFLFHFSCKTSHSSSPLLQFEEIYLPSGANTVFPNLLNSGESLVLSWIDESVEAESQLLLSEWNGESWTPIETAASGKNWFVNWADFPAIGMNNQGGKFAHFLAKSAEGTYDYDIQLVFKKDDSSDWELIGKPYQDTTKGEHGFVSMFPVGEDQLGIVWLDGRKYATENKEMMLMGNLINPDGSMDKAIPLDERVCDCCQTNAVQTRDGAVIVYRNRSEDEIRDIYRVILKDGEWSDPVPVANDSWKISGCPVNGPAIDANGNRIVVSWFTNAGDSAKVKVAISENGGETFGEPKQIDLGNPLGRVDVKFDRQENIWVSWMENVDTEAEIFLRKISKENVLEEPIKVSTINEHRASGFPRMEILNHELYLVWTNSNEPSSLMMVKTKM